MTVIYFCLQKKSWEFTIFFYINNVLVKNFATFSNMFKLSNIFKAKESPRVTFERRKRVSQPEFTDQDLQINMIMWYLEIKIFFHKLIDFEKKLVTFPLFNSCLLAEMISELWKFVPSKSWDEAFFAYRVITWSMSHVTRWVIYHHPKWQGL